MEERQFSVEFMWNREFHFNRHSDSFSTIEAAIKAAKALENMADRSYLGEYFRVKKTRIVDEEGKVVWEYGRRVKY